MSLRPRATVPNPAHERIQREHELNRALEAARSLQARLEMLGDRQANVRSVRRLRDEIAGEINLLVASPPCQDDSEYSS